MRLATAAAIALLAALVPQTLAKPRAPVQEIKGEIVIGTPNCTQSAHRRVYLAAGETADGVTGYEFDVEKKSWRGRFSVEVTDATEITGADLTMHFYAGFGEVTGDVTPVNYDQAFGGEKGVVPPGATKAIVMLCQGENPHSNGPDYALAAQASFTYVAYPPKRTRSPR